MSTTVLYVALAVSSGGLIGIVLGLIGSGGSILAVPLLVYVVGVSSPHIAIGTAALAVGLNAAFSLAAHARAGTVKWPCAMVFAAVGMAGAVLGAEIGKSIDGQRLLALFGIAMIVIGLAMARAQDHEGDPDVRLTRSSLAYLGPRLLATGLGTGMLAGFFGIGGGFLIVPGLMLATGMPLTNAIGTSLVAVTAFGLTTAGSYAWSNMIDLPLAALVIGGGAVGSFAGVYLNSLFATNRKLMSLLFAGVVILIGSVIFWRGVPHIFGG